MGVSYYAKLIYGVPFSEAIKEETVEEEIEVIRRNPRIPGSATTNYERRLTKIVKVGNRQFTLREFNDARWEKGGILQDEKGNSYVHMKYPGSDNLEHGVLGVATAIACDNDGIVLVSGTERCTALEKAHTLLESFGLEDKIGLHLMLTVS